MLGYAIEVIGEFGIISGFAINWGKSATLFNVNGDGESRAVHSPDIRVVDSFKYPGLLYSRYLDDNLDPLLNRFKDKYNLLTWSKLPLSVAGRCNLVKMVWLPKGLYVLQNSPV